MRETTSIALLRLLEDDLMGITFIANTSIQRLKLMSERSENRACHAVKVDDCKYGCSICGYDGWMGEDAITNYCPECGAKVVNGE